MMYYILRDNFMTEELNKIPKKRNFIKMEEVLEMRKVIGQGVSLCKRFLERCDSVDEAVILYHNIMQKIC